MLKSKIGYSTNEDSTLAGKETAQMALEGKNGTIGFLYTSVDYNQEEVIKGIREENKDMPIIGCTSSGGIIVPDGMITSDHGFAGMMVLDDKEMEIGVAASPKKGDARETGRKVAMEAVLNAGKDYTPAYYYMVASPAEEEYYVKGIQDVIGDVPFFGGSAADNAIAGDWKIFCNDEVFGDGVAVAFFYVEKEIVTTYTGAYEESKNVGIITKVENDRKLVEIDGVSALKKYAEWLETTPDKLRGQDLLTASITRPLGVKDMLGNLIAVRHPMFGDDRGTKTVDDDAINLGNKVVENTAIIQLETTVDGLIKSTGKVLKETRERLSNPGAYLLVHCGGRKVGIDDRINEVHEELVKEANGVPFMTVFTFGEYGYNDHSANTCGGLMLSFTGFEK